jgi:hypothetical protein
LAPWYEGYSVPNSSIVFGLLRGRSQFWINLGILALATLWICSGGIPGLHDGHGTRMVWIATLLALIAALWRFTDHGKPSNGSFSL